MNNFLLSNSGSWLDIDEPEYSEWARGRIKAVSRDAKATVYFTDYGHELQDIPFR